MRINENIGNAVFDYKRQSNDQLVNQSSIIGQPSEMLFDSETRKLAAAMNRDELDCSSNQRTVQSRNTTGQINMNDNTAQSHAHQSAVSSAKPPRNPAQIN